MTSKNIKASGAAQGEKGGGSWRKWLAAQWWRWLAVVLILTLIFFMIIATLSLWGLSSDKEEKKCVATKVSVGERYIIEKCEITRAGTRVLVSTYAHSDVDGGEFLFFLTGVSEDCAEKFKKAKVGEDYLIFNSVRGIKSRGTREWNGEEYVVMETSMAFRQEKSETRRVESKPEGAIATNE